MLHWPYFSVVIHSVLPFNIEKHVAFASRFFPEAPLCLYHLSVETEENSLESSGGKLLLSWFLAVAVAATVMEV